MLHLFAKARTFSSIEFHQVHRSRFYLRGMHMRKHATTLLVQVATRLFNLRELYSNYYSYEACAGSKKMAIDGRDFCKFTNQRTVDIGAND